MILAPILLYASSATFAVPTEFLSFLLAIIPTLSIFKFNFFVIKISPSGVDFGLSDTIEIDVFLGISNLLGSDIAPAIIKGLLSLYFSPRIVFVICVPIVIIVSVFFAIEASTTVENLAESPSALNSLMLIPSLFMPSPTFCRASTVTGYTENYGNLI